MENVKIIGMMKRKLNSDQQFHQQQQNKTITSHLNTHTHTRTKKCDVGSLGPGLGNAQKCCGVKPVNVITILTILDNNCASSDTNYYGYVRLYCL